MKKNCIFFVIIMSFFISIPIESNAETISGETSFPAWSGFWWPKNHGGLINGAAYRGTPAPIQKYDLYVDGYQDGAATNEFIAKLYDPDAPYWQGLCHAFSASSVTENIDFKPSVNRNILFRIGDKKGLITVSHDRDYMNATTNSGTPEHLHYWLLKYIKDEKRGFYADIDAGDEYWSYPAYKFEMTTSLVQGGLDVVCKVFFADDFVVPDYIGTKIKEKSYYYRLYLQNGEIVSGEWTGSSIEDHPESFVLPNQRASTLTNLDYQIVKKIAVSSDDELESGESFIKIMPGGYNLLLLDPDNYMIEAAVGDEINIGLTNIDGQDVSSFEILDGSSKVVYSGTLESTKKNYIITSVNPPYYLKINKPSYSIENFTYYRLDYDLKTSNVFVVPKIKQFFYWNGMAVSNMTEKTIDNIFLTGYSKNGTPLQTFTPPFSLAPGAKKTFVFEDFDISPAEKSDFITLKTIGRPGIKSVYLAGSFSKYMTGDASSTPATRLVLPDLPFGPTTYRSLSWGISNPSNFDANLTMGLYSSTGIFYGIKNVTVPGNESLNYTNTLPDIFSSSPENGWIIIDSPMSTSPFAGYAEWLTGGSKSKSENLPLCMTGKAFCLPHIETRNPWTTRLVLINISDKINSIIIKLYTGSGTFFEETVKLNPREKRNISIKDIFSNLDDETISKAGAILSSNEEMSGYCAFENSMDDLYCQLMPPGMLVNEMDLPHNASDAYWWTAIVLFNPLDKDVKVIATPFDDSGNAMAGLTANLVLPRLTKNVSTMSALFGETAEKISMVKFSVESGDKIYAFYAFGSNDGEMIAGGSFK